MLNIIDKDFNFLGQIDNYSSFISERSFYQIGAFQMELAYEKENFDILKKDNIIFNAPKKPYIITFVEVNSAENTLLIRGEELKNYLSRWVTKPPTGQAYHRLNANAETIMKTYVQKNCEIPYLEIAADQARGNKFVFQTRYKQLDEELAKIGLASGLGWSIELDLENKKYIFDVLEGVDRTAGQDENSRAIFSDEFDNLVGQKLTQSKSGYKNVAIVAGQGEGEERTIAEVGQASGFDRYEVFIDARDIEDENDLPDRGLQKLSEFEEINSFESKVLTKSNLIYEEDYDLGDIVTVQNKDWEIIANARLESITEVYDTTGLHLEATFGKTIPTFTDVIKKELDQPIAEGANPDKIITSFPEKTVPDDDDFLVIKDTEPKKINYQNLVGKVTGDLLDNINSHKAEYVQQLSTNGYQKLPNGLILQWGESSIAANTGSQLITYPIAFPSKCLHVDFNNKYLNYKKLFYSTGALEKANILVFPVDCMTGDAPNVGSLFTWMAIGY